MTKLNTPLEKMTARLLKSNAKIVELLQEIADALKKPQRDPNQLIGAQLGPGEALPLSVEQIAKAMSGLRMQEAAAKPAPRDTMLTPVAPETPVERPITHSGMPDFDQLKGLLNSDLWPEAVDPKFVCGDASEEDKFDRAEGILDMFIDADLEKLKVLDFGCGEGHLAVKALEQKPKLVVGYDIEPQWDKHGDINTLVFTNNWADVLQQGPYNVIVIYDVLDHISNENGGVIEALRKLRHVTAPGCKVFVQTHPWCGRTGGHIYNQINKAFAHLVFSEAELKEMGFTTPAFTRKVIHPLATYQEFFNAASFQIKHSHVTKEPVESFFSDTPLVARRIKANWRDSRDPNLRSGSHFPKLQMEQHFIKYVLG